ncbi:MAG TPA: sugar nucleotide-binding protein [Candidatus Fournierella excrementigallinarum]|nr:sugar nucleotide-binding protein [Candidatus Fournierella excrementigallinarum]
MKRVLVTGAGGFVGARIMAQLGDGLELVAAPAGALRTAGPEEVERLVDAAAPEVILHTAAISDTGYCEQHPEESFRANVELPVWLARAARHAGAKLVAFSSDQVYAGLEGPGPFDEAVPLHPANIYGRHKRQAEERVLDQLDSAVLLRATWLYDLPGGGLPIRGNLPLNLLAAAKEGRRLAFSAGDLRGVTWARQAVENLLPALEWPGGVYNFGCESSGDMYATALEFCRLLGLNEPPVEKACWQRCLAMDGGKARRLGADFGGTAEGFARCLAARNK